MVWPGWDSIADTGWWSNFWFWFGIGCLFALGASEVISHKYGLRRDELVDAAGRTAAEQYQHQADNAEARRRAEVEGLQKQLAEADKKVAALQKSTTFRSLTPEQKQALIAALSPFAGQKVAVATALGSDDGLSFANDFIEVFHAAHWVIDPQSPSQAIYDKIPIGLEPTINQEEAEAQRITPGYVTLLLTLVRLELMPSQTAFMNPKVPKGLIEMRIGIRQGTTLNR